MARALPDETARRFAELLTSELRAPTGYWLDTVTGEPVAEFDPALTPAEQALYGRLLRIAKSRVVGIAPAEYAALEAGITRLRTYRVTASPTNAATVQAVKDLIDVIRAILRD